MCLCSALALCNLWGEIPDLGGVGFSQFKLREMLNGLSFFYFSQILKNERVERRFSGMNVAAGRPLI